MLEITTNFYNLLQNLNYLFYYNDFHLFCPFLKLNQLWGQLIQQILYPSISVVHKVGIMTTNNFI